MRRALVAGVVLLSFLGPHALAAAHAVTIGNYYFQDDSTMDRKKIVVHQGDQITFTVRQAGTPHTADIDELGIHSGDLIVGDTFTTQTLSKAGNFYLYCRHHEPRGHFARVIVLAAPVATHAPRPAVTTVPTAKPRNAPVVKGTVTTPSPSPTATLALTPTPRPTVVATPVPVGLGRAAGAPKERQVGNFTSDGPWTRAVWWLLIASVPIVGIAGFALGREAKLRAAAEEQAEAEARAASAKKDPAKRKPKPKR